MLRKQLELGKLAATGAGGGGVAVPEVVPGLLVQISGSRAPGAEGGMDNHHSAQAMHAHYHQAVQLHGQPTRQSTATGKDIRVEVFAFIDRQ